MGIFDKLSRIGDAAVARMDSGSQLTADAVAAMKSTPETRSFGDKMTIAMARAHGIVIDPDDYRRK